MRKFLVIVEPYERHYSPPPIPTIEEARTTREILKKKYYEYVPIDSHEEEELEEHKSYKNEDWVDAIVDLCDGGDAISIWEIKGTKLKDVCV